MVEEKKVIVKMFNGANFESWKMQINDTCTRKISIFLSYKAQKPKEMAEGDWKVLDQKALGAIIPDIDNCV